MLLLKEAFLKIIHCVEIIMEKKIYKLLCKIFKKSLTDKYIGLDYQLFIMSLRSIIPFEKKIGCKFNKDRYSLEYKILEKYFSFENPDFDYLLSMKKNKSMKDNLILCKILPIVISNTHYKISLNESLRLILFYTYDVDSIVKTIILSSLLYEYIEGNIDFEKIYDITKQRLIEFSVSNFYDENFGIKIKNNYIIKFEKSRIEYLMNNSLNEFLNNNIQNTLYEKLDDNNIILEDNIKIIENLSKYLYKLRTGIIDPDKLRLGSDLIIELDRYILKDKFVHPVLGICKILDKKDNEIDIRTKIGKIKVRI